MELNKFIDVAGQFNAGSQRASLEQDNAQKTAFALKMMERLPQEPPPPVDAPRIPSLGALAIPN